MENQDNSSTTLADNDTHDNIPIQSPLDLISNADDDTNYSLLSIHFNQDGGCLAVGTSNGFRICNVYPFEETFRRKFSISDDHQELCSTEDTFTGGGGIGYIEMLFRCNLLAIVGGGPSPHYPPNKVMIWDDHIGRPIGELSFRQRVLGVKLRRDRICVALSDRIYVYNFGNLALLDTIATGGEKNGLGLLCISTDARVDSMTLVENSNNSSMVLACPSLVIGQVRVELYGYRKTVFIDAHESSLAAMVLSVDGVYLCTASEKGTIIRLFETGWKPRNLPMKKEGNSTFPSSVPLREFRRGVEPARISSIAMSLDKGWIACTSDRGTTHIFRTRIDDSNKIYNSTEHDDAEKSSESAVLDKREKSTSKLVMSLLPKVIQKSTKKFLLEGETSVAQIRGVPFPKVCSFVPDHPNMIAVAGVDDYGSGCLTLHTFGKSASCRHETNECTGILNEDPTNAQENETIETIKVGYHRFFKKKLLKKPRGLSTHSLLNEEYYHRALVVHEGVEEEVAAISFKDTELDDFIHIEHGEPKHQEVDIAND